MKIISLGSDNSILDKNSSLGRRAIEYGELAGDYVVIVPAKKFQKVELSAKTVAYGSGGANKLVQLFKVYNLATRLCRQDKYDAISVQDQYYLALIGLRLAKRFKAGLEIQVHGFEKFYGWRKLIAKYVIPRANAVRCVGQRLKKQLVNDFGVVSEKITVVPIYSKLRIKNDELRIKEKSDSFIFLTVGRLVPVKNVGLQIEAIAEVIKKNPKVELWIVGDGTEKKKLERLSYELRVTSYVKFLGWKENLEDYYNQADVFMLTSNSEGWGLAAIEAAASALPIIMTDVGCAGEVIENNKSGFIIPVGDSKALEQAMIRMIKDENLRKRLATGAREAVSKLPSQAEILELYKLSWQKAINNK